MAIPLYNCWRTIANEDGFPIGIPDTVTKDEFFSLFGYEPNYPPVDYIYI